MNHYSLIYADPAWSYGNTISNGAAVDHYPTMSLLDMKRLPVWELAADNAVLAMWYTGTHNQEAIELAEAWGFTVRTMKGFTWVKLNQLAELRITKALAEGDVTDFYDFLALLNAETRMNGGNYTRANTEDVLIATRGAGNWWLAVSAALTVKKKRNYAVSIGGDMASDKPITAQQAADLLIVSARVIYRLIDSGELAGRKVGNKYRTTEAACIAYLKTPRDPVIANAGEHKGEVLCQSPSGAACGTVISLRRQEKELGDLLARGTKSRLRSSTTS